MKRAVSLLASLLIGCGGVHSPGYPGEFLFEIRSWLNNPNEELNLPSDWWKDNQWGIALQWERMPAEAIACFNGLNGTHMPPCAGRLLPTLSSNTLHSTFEPSQINPSFRSSVHTIPKNALLEGEGFRFGYAYPVLYHDRNENGLLDLVEPQSTEATDSILASSLPSDGNRASFLFYCEGDCAGSPAPEILKMLGCKPDSAEGFSLITLSLEDGCLVHPFPGSDELASAELHLIYDTTKSVQQQMCVPEPPLFPPPTVPPPLGREVFCRSERVYEFVQDPKAVCEQIERVEAPEGSTLPTWWPCLGKPTDDQAVSESFGPSVVRVWAQQLRLELENELTGRHLSTAQDLDQSLLIDTVRGRSSRPTSRRGSVLPMASKAP